MYCKICRDRQDYMQDLEDQVLQLLCHINNIRHVILLLQDLMHHTATIRYL